MHSSLLPTSAVLAGVLVLLAVATTMSLPAPHPMPAASVKPAKDFVTFSPKTFTIKDTDPAVLTVKLNDNPGAVKPKVFFEADGVRFSKCSLDYDSGSYDKAQEIRLFPKASFTKGKSTSVLAARLAWQGNADHGRTQSMSFTREVSEGRLCEAKGDPHYTTFDRETFDFMGKKCYYLFKSPTFVVQTRLGPYHVNNKASVNVGAAVVFGKAVYVVDCLAKTADTQVVPLSGNTQGIHMVRSKNGNNIDFNNDDGSQVKIVMNAAGQAKCNLDITVVVPACYKTKTSGLCGTYNDDKKDDFTLQGGGTVKKDNQKDVTLSNAKFGNSWELKPDEDIFVKKMQASIIAKMEQSPQSELCSFPGDLTGFGIAPAPVGYDAAPVAAVAAAPDYAVTPLPVVTTTNAGRTDQPFVDFVTALCTKVLTIPGFNTMKDIPANTQYIADCVADCKLGGTLDPIDKFRIAYQQTVQTMVSASLEKFKICEKTGLPRDRKPEEVAAMESSLGMGNFKCPTTGGDYGAMCSDKGSCQKYGCECNNGFTMFDCTLDLAAEKAKIPPAPAAAAAAAGGEYGGPPPADEYRR